MSSHNRRLGFILKDTHFLLHGSNVEEVVQVGNTLDRMTGRMYLAGNSNVGVQFGIYDSNEPKLIVGDLTGEFPAFTINTTSNFVGINTDDPKSTLHVGGSMTVEGQMRPQGHIIPSENDTFDLGSADFRWRDLYLSGHSLNVDGVLISKDEETGGVRITDSENAVVPVEASVVKATELRVDTDAYLGGTLHASNLHIYGILQTVDATVSNSERILVRNLGDGPALTVVQEGAQNIAEFYDDANPAFVIVDGGNVGVGTGVPQARLDVAGDARVEGTVRVDAVVPLGEEGVLRFGGATLCNVSELYVADDAYLGGTLHASNLNIWGKLVTTNSSVSNSERIVVKNMGDGPGLTVIQTGSNTLAEFWDDDVLSLIIADGGSVGIGTGAPRTTLDVVGNMYITGNLYPTVTREFDLGSPDLRFRDIYLSGSTVHLDENTLSVNPETGDLEMTKQTVDPNTGTSNTTTIVFGQNTVVQAIGVQETIGVGIETPDYRLHVYDGDIGQSRGGVTLVHSAVGDRVVTTPGAHELLVRIGWENMPADDTQMIRVSGKCHVVGGDVRGYRRFDALINTFDNGVDLPNCDVDMDMSSFTNGYVEMTPHTFSRYASQAVDLQVGWESGESNYRASLTLDVCAPTALGKIYITRLN